MYNMKRVNFETLVKFLIIIIKMSERNQNQPETLNNQANGFDEENNQACTSFFLNFTETGELMHKSSSQGNLTGHRSKDIISDQSLRLSIAEPIRSARSSEVHSPSHSPRENQIYISESLITQLQTSKIKLISQLKHFQQKYQKMQNDKLDLRNQISGLKNEISSLKANEKIFQDQIYDLSNTNTRLVDELNFQRELCNDYHKQNLTLKMAIKNIVVVAKQMETQRNMSHDQIEEKIQQIQSKMKTLKNEITSLKEQISDAKNSDKELGKIKEQLSHYVKNLQAERFSLKGEIRNLHQRSMISLSNQGLVGKQIHLIEKQMQDKRISKLEEENKRLNIEVVALRDQSAQFFSTSSQNSPRMHTNTQYVQKIIAEHLFQVQNLKEEITRKEEQCERMREQAQQNMTIHNKLNEQLERIKLLTGQEQKRLIMETQQEVQKLRKQNEILNRKNDQFVSSQKKLKEEIVQKDKIIMVFVEQQKKNKGK